MGRRIWQVVWLCVAVVSLGGGPVLAQGSDPALRGHGGPVRALITLPDGRTLVSGGFDSAIIVWDADSGAALRVLRFHDSTVNALAATPDGCFVSGGEDGRIAQWCGDASRPRRVLTGHQGPISALAVAADGRAVASASWDRRVLLWSLDQPEPAPRTLIEHTAPANGVAFTRDGRSVVSAVYDGTVQITPLTPGAATYTLQLPTAINGLAVAPDGAFWLAAADGRLRVVDAQLRAKGEIELPDGPLTALTITADGRQIAVAGLRTPVTILNISNMTPVAKILGPGLPVWALAFSSDGTRLFSGGADRAVRRWDVDAGGAPVGSISAPHEVTTAPARGTAPEPGAELFKACQACHTVAADQGHRAGPTLHGVFGRRIGTAPGYAYSDALKQMAIVWTAETISKLFEVGPSAYTPGTKMPEQRITNPDDRKALIEWLERQAR